MRFYENQIPFVGSINDLDLFLHQQGLFINLTYYPGDEIIINVPEGLSVLIDGEEVTLTTKIFKNKGESYTVQYYGHGPDTYIAGNKKITINKGINPVYALKFTAIDGYSELELNLVTTLNFEISEDGIHWYSWDGGICDINNGGPVYVRGNNPNGINTNLNLISFEIRGKVSCEGNIMSLLGENVTEIPNTYCFAKLFKDCVDLISAPELPATVLTDFCYYLMFSGCTNLVTVPSKLPSNQLYPNCYNQMFSGCSSLEVAPELPAIYLAQFCYCGMFENCSSLEKAPTLPALGLVNGCYNNMFKDCSSLSFINAQFTSDPTPTDTFSATMDWVEGVASEGCFVKNPDATWNITGNNGIPTNWIVAHLNLLLVLNLSTTWGLGTPFVFDGTVYYVDSNGEVKDVTNEVTIIAPDLTSAGNKVVRVLYNTIAEEYVVELTVKALKFTASGNSTLGMTIGTRLTLNLSASTDGCNWSVWNGETIDIADGKSVYIKGNNPNGLSTGSGGNNYANFTMTGSIACEGNVMHLLGENVTEIPCAYCFYYLFPDCTSLTTAPELPAITLAERCYEYMFYNCTSLTKAPELPATTLTRKCYSYMFRNCTSLTTAPSVLPATTLAEMCYEYMFKDCTSLTSAPELPATTLAEECYSSMFEGCTSLTTAPELPATTLGNSCYETMFDGCTSLVTAPELPATTLTEGCYCNMFHGCTSLVTAPDLPAATLAERCYLSMFLECSSLNYIKMMATDISASACLSDWVDGVASTGTFVKRADVTLPYGDSGIPDTWKFNYPAEEGIELIEQLITYSTVDYEPLLNSELSKFSDVVGHTHNNIEGYIYLNGTEATIPAEAFKGNKKIHSIKIDDSNFTSIGASAFLNSSLAYIRFSDSVTSIGNDAFYGSELVSITYVGSRDSWDAISKGTHFPTNIELEITEDEEIVEEEVIEEPGEVVEEEPVIEEEG